MSLTLTANIDATVRELRVTGTVDADIVSGFPFRLDAEALVLLGFGRRQVSFAQKLEDRNLWRVRRGVIGSTPASHTAGATILAAADAWLSSDDETQPGPFPEGGASQEPGPYEDPTEATPESHILWHIMRGDMEPAP